jgi:hypothetical protein
VSLGPRIKVKRLSGTEEVRRTEKGQERELASPKVWTQGGGVVKGEKWKARKTNHS